MIKEAFSTTGFILIAILLGAVAGLCLDYAHIINNYVDYLILILVFLVFIDIPFKKIVLAVKQPKALIVAWLTNFLILPFLGFGLTKLFLPDQPLIAIGLAVYFMSPCTDWFLGFTRMAQGNTGLGSILLPINMITQLLLYPFLLQWFSQHTVASVSSTEIMTTLFNWFIVPAVLAVVLKLATYKLPVVCEKLSMMTNWVLYVLVFAIFSVYIEKIINDYAIFGVVLLTVLVFFAISFAITEFIAKKAQLNYEDHVLYTITTTARNAPLMLGLTMTAIPNQPLIYTALIIGMLIEFPYLALQVLRFHQLKNKTL